jgi:SAM-dependent methyltransferase
MSVALAYDQWSSVYDTNVNPTRDLEAVALRDILDLKGFASAPADTRSIERILEVGCGTGKNTVYFAGREGARVVFSVDLSEKMLEKARDRLADAPPAKCKIIFQQADVLVMDDWKSLIKLGPNSSESMGDDDGDGVDLVSFSLVLEHMEDLSTVFAKAAAVTRAGGLLYVGELHPLKQYAGSKARFENESGETTVVTCFNHHVSDFLDAAAAAGYRLLTLKEFFDNDDRGSTPRILTMLFQKLEHRHYSVPKAARENNSLVARHNAAIQTREGMEVEICLSDIESAMAAQRGGATSVELCSDRAGGGVTPALGLIQECVRRYAPRA